MANEKTSKVEPVKEEKILDPLEREMAANIEKEMKRWFWFSLKRNHPLAYEISQWMTLAIAILAIIINIVKMANG